MDDVLCLHHLWPEWAPEQSRAGFESRSCKMCQVYEVRPISQKPDKTELQIDTEYLLDRLRDAIAGLEVVNLQAAAAFKADALAAIKVLDGVKAFADKYPGATDDHED